MNPLLSTDFLIPFDQITAEHVRTGIKDLIRETEERISKLSKEQKLSYESTLASLDKQLERLQNAFTVAYHLNSVATTAELREAFHEVYPLYSAFMAKVSLNSDLWQLLKRYAETAEAKALTGIRKRHLEKSMRDFIRAGADLSEDKKERVEALKVELSQLQNKFSENILDSSNSFELLITDKNELEGLPESSLAQAKTNAEAKGLEGYRFSLQIPSFLPFMKYVKNQDLRKHMYNAYMNRASEGDFDNRPLIPKILELRQELSELLNYPNFADYRLEESMVKSGSNALQFEDDLYQATLPYWQAEIESLKAFAHSELGLETLEPWDVNFVIEQLRKAKFDFDDEVLRPFFPLNNVLSGMFSIAEKLFAIRITEKENKHVWHEDVQFFEIHDADNKHIASFYADFFPREDKRGGAWMNSFVTGKATEDGFSPHLGFIATNFTPPQNGQAALLTHNEVETTFHEFGHLLHHCLSRVEVPSLAGTNVPWDFVELPSQIMENWAWEREALNVFAKHIDTLETIPDDLYEKMMRSRTFMAAHAQMRQLSFGAVDLDLHISYSQDQGDVMSYGKRRMEKFSIDPSFANNNFLAAFGHVFSGGYAAAYYSYKWSEVLDADAFSRFKEEGIFNPETGKAFVDSVLSRGDSADANDLYKEFMGRDPNLNALLERNLGVNPKAAQ